MDSLGGEMPGIAVPVFEHRAPAGLELRTGTQRFRILDIEHDTCLIEMKANARLRGYADIYDGAAHVARCLIVLVEPDGEYARCVFKRRTEVRSGPPVVDFPATDAD